MTTVLLAGALFALGCTVRIGAFIRIGRQGLVLGALSSALIALAALGALALADPAG